MRDGFCLDGASRMPTLNLQIGASGDDGNWATDASYFDTSDAAIFIGNGLFHGWFLFTGIPSLAGATIDSAFLSLKGFTADAGTALTKIYANDVASPALPVSAADANSKVLTTAGVDWDSPGLVTSGFTNSPDIKAVIQELANSHELSSILIIVKDDGGAEGNYMWPLSYDNAPADAGKLVINYTSSVLIPVLMNQYRQRWA